MRKKDRIFIATEQGTPENIAWLKSQGFEVVVDRRLLPDEWKILVEKKRPPKGSGLEGSYIP